jgi:hypothetical protein
MIANVLYCANPRSEPGSVRGGSLGVQFDAGTVILLAGRSGWHPEPTI